VRERAGLKTIPPRRSKDLIRDVLARNELMGFVNDQHTAKHRAIVCKFFGMWAATSPAPVRFALETGAPIIPVRLRRLDDRGHHRVEISEPLALEFPHSTDVDNLRHNVQRINDLFETWIRETPEQWLWLHKRWKVHDNPTGWALPSSD
jgi:KDO2-lipid IV(A) lauroyltransferase